MEEYAIEVNHLTKIYKLYNKQSDRIKEAFSIRKKCYHQDFYALKDVNFKVKRGEALGIVGKNGSGKSTILKIITGVLQQTEGEVKLNGRIAALLELGAGFDGEMTVKENIFLRGALLGYQKEFILEKYGDIIEFSELKEFENVAYNKLSSGMKSKLAFALSSFVTPDVLILDEVLSVGDMAFRKKSEKRMKELFASGVTTILVSHSLNQIREMCSSVLWLEKGEKKGMGNTKEICDDYEKYMQKK